MNAVTHGTPQLVASRRFRITGEQIALGVATLVLVAGWLMPLGNYLTPRSGAGYALGIIGGSLMLALLIYPARKRLSSLGILGSNGMWFRIHMVLGILGPLCIVYHCCYHLGATNSNVALVSMLIVAGSGLVGRYLYARIHHGLYGHKASLAEFRAEAERLKGDIAGVTRVLPDFVPRLDRAAARIANGVPVVPKALAAVILFWFGRRSMRRYVHRTLRAAAASSRIIAGHRRALELAADRHAESRLAAARRVAEFQSCETLFGLWHVLHVPLFGMLFIAGIVHVVAVNLY